MDKKLTNFNSHAHVERDAYSFYRSAAWKISTHTLTWSVTPASCLKGSQSSISTHTLTWSVTDKTYRNTKSPHNFNSHAHVERDILLSL